LTPTQNVPSKLRTSCNSFAIVNLKEVHYRNKDSSK